MTVSSLRALTRKALVVHAKKCQIVGWHDMTKDELVAALATYFRRQRGNNGASKGRGRAEAELGPSAATRSKGRSENGRSTAEQPKPAQRSLGGSHLNGRRLLKPTVAGPAPAAACDSLVAEAHDPCWIHVRWTLSRATLARAEAALAMQWHSAVPVLRIFDVTADETGSSVQTRLRDVEIHGDVDHWYLPVEHAPRAYKVQIGYRAPSGLFFVMASSNRVSTPRPGSHSLQTRDHARTESGSRSSLQFDKKPSYDLRALTAIRRTSESDFRPSSTAEDDADAAPPCPIELSLHAELIVHGMTDPHAELTLLGDRIPVSCDGTFSHRLSLEEGRQVIDAVVTTRNGCHQQTIVMGIERNTKVLEPQWFEGEG